MHLLYKNVCLHDFIVFTIVVMSSFWLGTVTKPEDTIARRGVVLSVVPVLADVRMVSVVRLVYESVSAYALLAFTVC